MPRRSSETSSQDTDLESLRYDIQRLSDEIAVLRQSVDALLECFDHAVLNGRVQYVVDPAEAPPNLASMALDPTAKDLQLNAVPPEQLDQLRAEAAEGSPASAPSERPTKQSHLF